MFLAKTQDFPEEQGRIDRGELVDLNSVKGPEQLVGVLSGAGFGGEGDRLAQRIWSYTERVRLSQRESQQTLPNVGALARLRVTRAEVMGDAGWSEARRKQFSADEKAASIPLVSLRKIKPLLVDSRFVLAFLSWLFGSCTWLGGGADFAATKLFCRLCCC